MARGSAKGNGQRGEAVALPSPSITLDVVMPRPGGGVDQMRPSFPTFEEARRALVAYEAQWKKTLAAHKKAARTEK